MTDEAKLCVNTLRECAVATQCSKCVVFCGNDECLFTAAAKVIESLAAELEQIKRERDAAVEQVKVLGACAYCKHDSFCSHTIPDCMNCKNERCPCYVCGHQSQWQWRGVQEEPKQ